MRTQTPGWADGAGVVQAGFDKDDLGGATGAAARQIRRNGLREQNRNILWIWELDPWKAWRNCGHGKMNWRGSGTGSTTP